MVLTVILWENAQRPFASREFVQWQPFTISGCGDGLCQRIMRRMCIFRKTKNITVLHCLLRQIAIFLIAIRTKYFAKAGGIRCWRLSTSMSRMRCILTAVPALSRKITVMMQPNIITTPEELRTESLHTSRRIILRISVFMILSAEDFLPQRTSHGSLTTVWRIILPGVWYKIRNINQQRGSSISFAILYPRMETFY